MHVKLSFKVSNFLMKYLVSTLIVEVNDLMDIEDLVDDFVTFYVAGI